MKRVIKVQVFTLVRGIGELLHLVALSAHFLDIVAGEPGVAIVNAACSSAAGSVCAAPPAGGIARKMRSGLE